MLTPARRLYLAARGLRGQPKCYLAARRLGGQPKCYLAARSLGGQPEWNIAPIPAKLKPRTHLLR